MNYKLKDICTRISSGKNKKSEEIKDAGKFPVYGGNGIRGFSDEYNFDGECVIVGRQGANCGNVRYFAGKAFMTDHAVVICTDEKTNTKYLSYLLSGLQLGRLSGQAAQPGISVGVLSKQSIDLPSVDYQNKVVRKISLYDDLIANNNKRIKILEKMAENLYKEWFVRFRFPGYETAEFVDGVPKGWNRKILKQLGDVVTGKTPSMEVDDNFGDEILFVKTPDMHGNMFVSDTSEKLSNKGHMTQPKKMIPALSLMVSCIGTGGIVSINTKKCHTNQQINSIILRHNFYLEWAYFICCGLRETIEMFGATGTTMTNLSKGKFEKLKILMPNDEVICSFHEVTSPFFENILRLKELNHKLIKQRDLLLPRLMSGKIQLK